MSDERLEDRQRAWLAIPAALVGVHCVLNRPAHSGGTLMRAYYNEFDPKAAAWLRELIRHGAIAPGDVDERSIVDVSATDLTGYTQCHFFAGIGGWSYALRLAGWDDDAPVWTGSCPCQPFSAIGEGKGIADERHHWPEYFRLIRERRPARVFGEQVASPDGLEWLDGVLADLEGADYAAGAADLCAAGVGAPHIRQRIYWVGYAERAGLEGHGRNGDTSGRPQATGPNAEAGGGRAQPPCVDAMPVLRGEDLRAARATCSGLRVPANRGLGSRPVWPEFAALACSDGWRRVQSGTFPLAYGIPGRVGRLRGYGNAIVPQVAARFVSACLDVVGGY